MLGAVTIGSVFASPGGPAESTPSFGPVTIDAAGTRPAADVRPATSTQETDVAVSRVSRQASGCSPDAPSSQLAAGRPDWAPQSVPIVVSRTRPSAVVLGDSYTSGYVGAGSGTAGWPALVGAEFGWRVKNLSVPGTGFVNPGWTNQPIRAQLAATIALDPGFVIVAGGHNDRRYGGAVAGKAADAVLERLHADLPDAILVVIGPIWQDGSPAASIVALRDHLRASAAALGAVFIDPLRPGWFAGRWHRFIGPDGIHPTNAGHRHMAALVAAALETDPRFASTPTAPTAEPTRIASDSVAPATRPMTPIACPS